MVAFILIGQNVSCISVVQIRVDHLTDMCLLRNVLPYCSPDPGRHHKSFAWVRGQPLPAAYLLVVRVAPPCVHDCD